MTPITLDIPLTPLPFKYVPYGKQHSNGRIYGYFSLQAKCAHWKRKFAMLAAQQRPAKPLDDELKISFIFKFPLRKKDKGVEKLKKSKPDVDNLFKLPIDALNESGWFTDDQRVSVVSGVKIHSKNPGILMKIELASMYDFEAALT